MHVNVGNDLNLYDRNGQRPGGVSHLSENIAASLFYSVYNHNKLINPQHRTLQNHNCMTECWRANENKYKFDVLVLKIIIAYFMSL